MSKHLKIISLGIIDSTNNYLRDLAEKGESEIVVVKAKVQTAGKGRMGRGWQSPQDKGIYASFLFRPKQTLREIQYLPLVLSLGVVKFLEEILLVDPVRDKILGATDGRLRRTISNGVKIKHPNDVLVNSKKIAGVLVEARSDKEKVDFAIGGIGLNVNSDTTEIPENATSLFLETKLEYDIEELFKKFVKQIVSVYNKFQNENINDILREITAYEIGNNQNAGVKDKPVAVCLI